MKWDPGVAADGETREVRVEICGNRATYGFTLDYDTAQELRDMITDALEHIEDCDRRKNPPMPVVWGLWLKKKGPSK